VLHIFDPALMIWVETDASLFALGGIISQQFADGYHPICFFSQEMTKAEKNYPVQEQEMLALIEVFRKYRH
jgi:hypothetical protein